MHYTDRYIVSVYCYYYYSARLRRFYFRYYTILFENLSLTVAAGVARRRATVCRLYDYLP